MLSASLLIELSPVISIVPALVMAPPESATPLSFNVLLASTWTAPPSVIVVPVTVVPSSVSVLPASTVSWPLL
ncbi:MAG: hypothetical protein E6G93_09570, partial [Alphaproteobacteria bacterium]